MAEPMGIASFGMQVARGSAVCHVYDDSKPILSITDVTTYATLSISVSDGADPADAARFARDLAAAALNYADAIERAAVIDIAEKRRARDLMEQAYGGDQR